MFCKYCGAKNEEGVKFCSKCGKKLEESNFEKKVKDVMNDVKEEKVDEKEAKDGTVMGILSYLGLLSLIPYFVEKKNTFVMYHAKQGLNLAIIETLATILVGFVPFIGGTLSSIVSLAACLLSILGIVNVCGGKKKELPVVNKIQIIK